ncbi:MAG: DNA repair protein RecO [Chlamydiales bacterium]|nr:DNA repair protein RecO [Chlamydiales bacterium]
MEETEGIVLKCLEYKDRERIITVFTKENGLVSLIVKGVWAGSHDKLSATTPFCQAQYIFKRGRSDLLRYHESSILYEHLELRSHYSHLEAAGLMAKTLLDSQLPGRPSHALYALFERCLKQIPHFSHPQTLTSSFLLKMLLLEGLISHEESDIPHLTPAEHELFRELTFGRSFQKLAQLQVPPELAQKVQAHFSSRIHQN